MKTIPIEIDIHHSQAVTFHMQSNKHVPKFNASPLCAVIRPYQQNIIHFPKRLFKVHYSDGNVNDFIVLVTLN